MQKTVKGKAYDTEVMQIVKKVTVGSYGDPDGYEEILFKAEDGTTFFMPTAARAPSTAARASRRLPKRKRTHGSRTTRKREVE